MGAGVLTSVVGMDGRADTTEGRGRARRGVPSGTPLAHLLIALFNMLEKRVVSRK